MGHLLSTVNPEASDLIQPIPPRQRLPGVGSAVVYHMRRGHGRNGRTSFPAVVQGHGERDTLMLTVIIDAGDMVDEQFVEQIGPGKDEGHCWEWPEGSQAATGIHGTIAALHTRIGDIEDEFSRMSEVVLGEFDAPKVSIIHIMQDFESRLRAVKAENGELWKYVGAAVVKDISDNISPETKSRLRVPSPPRNSRTKARGRKK